MKITTLTFIAILLVLTSCHQTNKDSKKGLEFYNLVNEQIAMFRPHQQIFIDYMTSCLQAIKDNNNAIVDTAELQSLFKVAKMKNFERQSNLEKITEFDSSLNYKTAVMNYFKSYNSFYQIEVPQSILVLGEKRDNRSERLEPLLLPKLKIIKEMELKLKEAQKAFKNKYGEP